jgi:hypothetical protein
MSRNSKSQFGKSHANKSQANKPGIAPHLSPDGRSPKARERKNKRHAASREAARREAPSHSAAKPEREITTADIIALILSYAQRCPDADCRRAGHCCGKTCMKHFWPHEEEKTKQVCRTIITNLANGVHGNDAIMAGIAVLDSWDAQQARWAEMAAGHDVEPAPKPPELPVEPAEPQVKARVRML